MTTSVATRALPPPTNHSFELRDADRLVGSISGDTVRFRGFGSAPLAAQAASVAHAAMTRRLARGAVERAAATEAAVSAVRQGNGLARHAADERPVARVVRTMIDDPAITDTAEYEIELRVPSPNDESRMRGIAYVMYRALRNSGVAWPLLDPEPDTATNGVFATRAASDTSDSTADVTRTRGGFDVIQRLLQRAWQSWNVPRGRAQRAGRA